MTREELCEMPELACLTAKQRQFVLAYVLDFQYNATAACREVYKNNSAKQYGFELTQKPNIKAAINACTAALAKSSKKASPEYALDKLITALEAAQAEGKLNEMIRSTEILMKHLGMFVERQEITGKDGEAIKMEKITEDVQSFTSAIARLAERGRPDKGTEQTQH